MFETFLVLRRNKRDMIKTVYWSSRKVPLSCPVLMKIEFSRQIFEKYPYIKFRENPFSGTEFYAGRQMDTDGYETNSGVSQF
jgi:hypothetical protein